MRLILYYQASDFLIPYVSFLPWTGRSQRRHPFCFHPGIQSMVILSHKIPVNCWNMEFTTIMKFCSLGNEQSNIFKTGGIFFSFQYLAKCPFQFCVICLSQSPAPGFVWLAMVYPQILVILFSMLLLEVWGCQGVRFHLLLTTCLHIFHWEKKNLKTAL